MGRWKDKGGRKIEEVIGRWNGKGEKGWRSVNIKKINVKNNYKKIEKKKFLFIYFFLPLSWKGSHKTLKLNCKGFEFALIVELNK